MVAELAKPQTLGFRVPLRLAPATRPSFSAFQRAARKADNPDNRHGRNRDGRLPGRRQGHRPRKTDAKKRGRRRRKCCSAGLASPVSKGGAITCGAEFWTACGVSCGRSCAGLYPFSCFPFRTPKGFPGARFTFPRLLRVFLVRAGTGLPWPRAKQSRQFSRRTPGASRGPKPPSW